MSSSQIRNLARRIHILERDRIQRKQANLGYSTIDGGALQAQDNDDNLTMIIGQQHDGTNTAAVVTGPTPPQPTVPVITAGPGMLRVLWGGTFADGNVAPMDFTRVTVHAVPTAIFEGVGFNVLDQAYTVGSITSAMGGEVTAGLGLEEHTVYLVSWSQAGKFSAISPTALGTPGDLPVPSVPPSASPTLKAVGMPTAILLVTDPIAPTDFLTFQFSADGTTGWTDLDNMPTRQNIWTADQIPGGTAFVVGTEYFFRVIAANSAGAAAPSNVESVQLDTAAIALVAAQVVTAELISEAISAGVVNVGSNITISADGGIEILQSDGGFTRLPSDGSSPQFTGAVIARELTVENGASIYGESDVSGTIDLNSAIKDPDTAPTTDAYYHVRDLAADYGAFVSTVGLCRNLGDDGWVTIITTPDLGPNTWAFLEVLDTGVASTYAVPDYGQNAMGGIVVVGGAYYWMYRKSTATWYVNGITDLGGTLLVNSLYGTSRASRPGLGVDASGTELLIATIDSSLDIRLDYVDTGISVTGTNWFDSGVSGNTDINAVFEGSADYGAGRWIVQYSTGVRVYNWTGTYLSADGWAKPYNWTANGLHWDGTYFWHLDPYGRLARLEPKAALTASWWAYAWVDSDTHTTLPSPRKNWTPPNRSLVTVTSATPPQSTDPGTHVANRIQVYAASSAVATLYEQGGHLPVGTVAWPYNPIRETSVAAPGANNWDTVAVPGELRSDAFDADGRIILLKGDGAGRTGPRSWDENGAPLRSTKIPAMSVYKTSAQALTLNVTTTIVMDQDRFPSADSGGMVLTSGVIQVPIEGWYQVDTNITWGSSTSDARRFLWIGYGSTTALGSVAHSDIIAWGRTAASVMGQTTSGLVYLEAGWYVGTKAMSIVNFGLDVSQAYMNNLSVHWVG